MSSAPEPSALVLDYRTEPRAFKVHPHQHPRHQPILLPNIRLRIIIYPNISPVGLLTIANVQHALTTLFLSLQGRPLVGIPSLPPPPVACGPVISLNRF